MKRNQAIFIFLFCSYSFFPQLSDPMVKGAVKKYNRQIVFSSEEITAGDEGKLLSEYLIGSSLYCRFYSDSTVAQFLKKWNYTNQHAKFASVMINFYIDDKFAGFKHHYFENWKPEEMETLNSYGFCLQPPKGLEPPVWNLSKEFSDFISNNLPKLDGEHSIKLEFFMSDKRSYYQKYASGSIKTKSDKNSMLAMAGITDPFQLNHLKKIVFSASPLSGDVNEAKLQNETTFGKPFYFRILMDNNMKSYITRHYGNNYALSYFKEILVRYSIDGNNAREKVLTLNFNEEEKKKLTVINGFLSGEGQADSKLNLKYDFEEFVFDHSRVLNGSHKIKIEVFLYDNKKTSELLGEGEFIMKLDPASTANNYKPKAAASDPALEAKMIAAYNLKHGPDAQAKKASLVYTDWEVIKNELTGAIIAKYRNAVLYVETKEGSCFYVEGSFTRDYEGNGKYSNNIVLSGLVAGSTRKMLCGQK